MMWGTLRRWLRRLRIHDLARDYQGSNIESDENRTARKKITALVRSTKLRIILLFH